MTDACPTPSPEEARHVSLQFQAEAVLWERVQAALDEAAATATAALDATGQDRPPPSRGYFAAVVHQKLYCVMCGADPDTFAGGRPEVAEGVIRNAENVARHYWGADIAPRPTPARPAGSPPPAR